MSGFHEISFPMRLALGAVGGPERRTEIVTLASGHEVRNAKWARARRRWDVGSAVSDLADLQALLNFFEARHGQLYGFRFRDPLDASSALPGGAVTATDQVLGVGDGAANRFQLVKEYGGVTRTILKPVAGTVRVALNGAEALTGWSVDTSAGTLLFDVPPSDGEVVTAGFEFECPVRFESDRLDGVIEAFGAGRVVSAALIELL